MSQLEKPKNKDKKTPLSTWQKIIRWGTILITLFVLGFCAYLAFIMFQLFAPEISYGDEARTQILGSIGINLPSEATDIYLSQDGFIGINADVHFTLPSDPDLLSTWFESETLGCIGDPLRPLTEDDLQLDLYRWWNQGDASTVVGAACGQTNSFYSAIVVDQSDTDSWTVYIKYFID